MATVALQMIVKDEYEELVAIIENAYAYFDELNITVSDKTVANKLGKLSYEKLNIKWRQWTNDFAAARNDNFAMATTDYVFWLDSDDTFDFTKIPKLVELAEKGKYEVIYLPYNYAQDETGRCIALHWRERLIKRSHPFEWRGMVHETYISDEPFKSKRVPVEVVHNGYTHVADSIDRNHNILLKAAAETDDPRYMHYLGLSHFTRKEYQETLDVLEKFIKLSGWDEEIYRSLCVMSEAADQLDDYPNAVGYAMQAAVMLPKYPQAYWLLTQFAYNEGDLEGALEWASTARAKNLPDSMSIVDPTNASRCVLLGAQAAYKLGDYATAWAWIKSIPQEPLAQELMAPFKLAAEKTVFVKLLPQIRPFFTSDNALWESLDDDVKYDGRVSSLREIATKPKTWSDKSIVIFCGAGFEPWGPDTLNKGMGGSEEAIVYLSRELAKIGWDVTVYNERDDEYFDAGGVTYYPWRYLDKRDNFNVLISWRQPVFALPLNAKVKIVDVHDTLNENIIKPHSDLTYFVKSNYHRNLYPGLPDKDVRVIGNGIAKEHFNER
jgi:tetratricopeptide (TPR) repeat protein